ncbi:hypothetical protein Scep_022612 [Stephania cephalantha]|uniref:BHLH domain-containing protein n=1 Tax=Stephania cephalantha TaxID=152367 RepID=A0AAP0FAZ6_9MAGN
MELMNQFSELNPCLLENHFSSQTFLCGGFSSNDSFLVQQQQQQQPHMPISFSDNLQSLFDFGGSNAAPIDHSFASTPGTHQEKKRKAVVTMSESSSGNSSGVVSETLDGGKGSIKRKNSSGRGKRGRMSNAVANDDDEKPKEVVHVRARRGQATDSHSLAERVRREKINERLRCLQDLVPGCYKTMGMAVMLDEIISYVQSLQNQVEFLSMKLTAASSFYDFNSDGDTNTQVIQGTSAYEAQEVERLVRGGGYGGGGVACFHSTLPL